MKFLKIFQAALLATAVTFSFTACDDDDDPEPGTENNDGGSTGTTTPPVADAGILFPVTSISDGKDVIYKFNYVDGRLVGGMCDYNLAFSIHYNPLRIQEDYNGEDGEYEHVKINNIKVNASGFVTYADITYDGLEYEYDSETETDVEYRWHVTGTGTFGYDKDGHMTSTIFDLKDGEDVDHTEINYTWSNGDLMKCSEHYTWNYSEDGDKGVFITTSFTYNLSRPNSGIFLPCVMDNFDEGYLWYAGLLGKPSQNIPTSYVSGEGEEGNGYTYTRTIDVKYNPNGSIAELTEKSGNEYQGDRYVYGYGATKAAAVSAPGTKKPVFGPAKRMIERMKSRRNNK
ncbi:MAG: DUF4595 domain-containing protein [Paraprevotella sp.]|nr:DUF4595 domain-containing protein [Paraprevotella sp.]